ncbi:MAG: phosphate ABC transporter, permease protein PstA [Deltaproteobacteria bacterium RBG_19FT_COMBO_60_16]|nr:MAG: phosphate ABC transporter, permease protein PstA [Deltaproteobacteria bacterium RBG_16_64_85]OGQ00584.1 MAG: phosphate ABC transporter, permease protein PstA [Deltaproteobacteria bacterium RBG_19FT_COMBO_60_16]
MESIAYRRRAADKAARVLFALSALLVILPLFLIFFDLLWKGARELKWTLLTDLPHPVGEPGGGIANGILGTLTIAGLAMAGGIPMAVMAGIYLAEYGRGKFASAVRFAVDTLAGVPSIIMGIFGYILLVLPMKRFSAWAGAAALAMIFIPVVVRTTEEMLRTVPQSVREAALALGIERWKTTLFITVRTATAGIVTGILLAMARIVGETAPLLFTALGNQFWQTGLDQPIAAVPLQVFNYAISPYEDWHDKAWAGAVVLIGMVLVISAGARYFTRVRK